MHTRQHIASLSCSRTTPCRLEHHKPGRHGRKLVQIGRECCHPAADLSLLEAAKEITRIAAVTQGQLVQLATWE
jgi:hypothetical protein